MCEGVSLAAVAAYAGLASAAVGAYSAYQTSSTSKKAANYNAQLAEAKAQDDVRAGNEAAAARLREARAGVSAKRVDYASRGLDFNTGSADETLGQIDFFGQVDAGTEKTNAQKRAWNARAQREGYAAEAANESPWRSASMSLIGDSGRVASSWYQYKKG